jgi:hypothetical protein
MDPGGELLALAVVDRFHQPDLVDELGLPDVVVGECVPAFLASEDQRLVEDVLDPCR